MQISDIFNVAKENRNLCQKNNLVEHYCNYDVRTEFNKLAFILDALGTAATYGFDYIDESTVSLTQGELNQVYADIRTYRHSERIVAAKLIELSKHFYGLIKAWDINKDNLTPYYNGLCKIEKVKSSTLFEIEWYTGKKYTAWSPALCVNFSTVELEDIASKLELEDEYAKEVFTAYKDLKSKVQSRKLLSNLCLIYSLEKDRNKNWEVKEQEKIDSIKSENKLLIKSIANLIKKDEEDTKKNELKSDKSKSDKTDKSKESK